MDWFRGRVAFRSRWRHLFRRRANAPAPRLVINMPRTRGAGGRTDWWYRSPVDLCYWFHLPIPMNHWAWKHGNIRRAETNGSNYRDCSPSYRNSSLPAIFPASRTSAIGNVKVILPLRIPYIHTPPHISFVKPTRIKHEEYSDKGTFVCTALWFNFAGN